MNLNFTKVTFDGELSELGADELRSIVQEFQEAQESNVAEFQEAAERIEQVEEIDFDGYQEARSSLIESVTDSSAFDEVPLSENQLEDCDFDELRAWQSFVKDIEAGSDDSDDDNDGDFDDIGQEPNINGQDGQEFGQNNHLVEMVDGISGVQVDTE